MSYLNSIVQQVSIDVNNSSSVNLAGGATFTGTGTSTLGVAGIQVTLNADQNCTIYVEQSPNNTNWDIVDTFRYLASLGGFGQTIQAVNSYVRVRVTNLNATTTTTFRLQTALCPIVEAVPRALDADGNLKVCIQDIESPFEGFKVKLSPVGELRTSSHVKIAGEKFEGSILDTSFWATTLTGTGAVSQSNSEATLATGVTANSTALLNSVRVGRYTGSYANYFRGVVTCPTITGTCVRRWGAFDANNGFFFEFDGTTLSIVSRKAGSDTKINSGSFNGSAGSTYTLDANVHTYEIYWTNSSAWFYIGQDYVHKLSGTTTPLCAVMGLKVGLNILNTTGNTNNNTLLCRTATINRIGNLETESMCKNITTAGTYICKYGAGRFKNIVIGTVVNGTITIYDNTTNSAPAISTITLGGSTSVPTYVSFDCPFNTGLTVVTSSNANITVVYE